MQAMKTPYSGTGDLVPGFLSAAGKANLLLLPLCVQTTGADRGSWQAELFQCSGW